MPMNRIQFQPGLSVVSFLERYGSERACEVAVQRARWPAGFECPACGAKAHSVFERAGARLWQCSACRPQTSLIAGTVFASTKLPLRTWFLAIFLLTQSKNNISALELKRQLGVCYRTAWLVKHKLMQAMFEREQGRGRGSENKVPFVAAVQTRDGHPLYARFDVIADWKMTTLVAWAKQALAPTAHVVSDGLSAFVGVCEAGCSHFPTARARQAPSTHASSGSTPCWATSSAPCRAPITPSKPPSTDSVICRVPVPLQPPLRLAHDGPPPSPSSMPL